jgi:hypothetical protein
LQIQSILNTLRTRQNAENCFWEQLRNALDPKSIFALRFGSISVTVGAAVRRHTSASKGDLSLRNVRPIDATFLTSTSRGTSCNIIQLMSAGELTLETLTADAENESQNVWSFAF